MINPLGGRFPPCAVFQCTVQICIIMMYTFEFLLEFGKRMHLKKERIVKVYTMNMPCNLI